MYEVQRLKDFQPVPNYEDEFIQWNKLRAEEKNSDDEEDEDLEVCDNIKEIQKSKVKDFTNRDIVKLRRNAKEFGIMSTVMNIVRAKGINKAQCNCCGKLMDVDSKEFVTLWGNLTLGLDEKIVGDNIDPFWELQNSTTICKECFRDKMLETIW